MEESQFKPGVAAIIFIAFGILTCILAFIVIKRQIMRFALKYPTDGPHAPIGHDAPKKMLQEIERRLNLVKDIHYEPTLVNQQNELSSEGNISNYKHIYRMKVVDSLKDLEDSIVEACGGGHRRLPGQDIRVYLLNLRQENLPLVGCESKLINEFVESYINARCDPIPDFGPEQYGQYMELFRQIKSTITTAGNPVQRRISRNSSQFPLPSESEVIQEVHFGCKV